MSKKSRISFEVKVKYLQDYLTGKKELNLQSLIRKKRKRYVKNIPQITTENVLNRDFSAATLNEK